MCCGAHIYQVALPVCSTQCVQISVFNSVCLNQCVQLKDNSIQLIHINYRKEINE